MLSKEQLKELDVLVGKFQGKTLTHYKGGKYLVTGFTLIVTSTHEVKDKMDGVWGVKYSPIVGGFPIANIEYTRPHWEFEQNLTLLNEEEGENWMKPYVVQRFTW